MLVLVLAAAAAAAVLASTRPVLAQAAADGPAMSGSAAAVATPFTLAQLFERLRARPRAKARFVEWRQISELTVPLESAGELEFSAPARLVKRTLRPRAETLMLDGTRLVVEQGGTSRSFQAETLPGVAALVGGLRSLLAGDLAALTADFTLELDGGVEDWILTAQPRSGAAQAMLDRLVVRGGADGVAVLEVELSGGDVSVTRILPW